MDDLTVDVDPAGGDVVLLVEHLEGAAESGGRQVGGFSPSSRSTSSAEVTFRRQKPWQKSAVSKPLPETTSPKSCWSVTEDVSI